MQIKRRTNFTNMNNQHFPKIKTFFLALLLTIIANHLSAQNSNGIFFQAVARDNYQNPANDRQIFVQTSIIQNSATGTSVLIEEHKVLTDAKGVFSISIGNGLRIGGTSSSISDIDWSKGPYFLNLKVAITPVGGNSGWDYKKEWVDMGTTNFGSVPYALYANSVAGFENKLNISDSAKMLAPYAKVSALNTELTTARAAELVLSNKVTANTASITSNTNSIALKAPIASPSFTGSVAVGTATPSASAVLDITSNSKGILIPRMSNSERDAVANPVNALLVFNTTNNRFEVYKTTCSCWIAISDGGSGIVVPPVPPVNTIPTLNNMNYTGLFRVGGTSNVVYTYSDSDGDAEKESTINWEIANDNNGTSKTTYSTSNSPTFTEADAGRYVRVKVTPRAATGALNGIDYYGSWNYIDPAIVPYASSISLSGNAKQGSLLSGAYTFTGGSGIENTLGSIYTWQTATSNKGANTSTITIPNGGSAFGKTIRPTINEVNRYIRFGVRAKDNASATATNFVYSDWVGPVTISAEEAPIVADVLYSPVPGTSLKLTSSYTYVDANNDPEGTSLYQWYTATDATGANQAPIVNANTKYFTPTLEQAGKYIGIGITPVAKTGTITGTEVVYYGSTPSAATANFTFESVTQSSTNFYINRIMDATDYITLSINVTSPGSITFSSPTVDGYSFNGGGVYSTGLQNIILSAKGTQAAYNAAGDIFTITAIGSSTQTRTITITNTNIATTIANNPPSVSNINYRGVFRINGTASAVYTYADQEKDAESATTIHWEIANDNSGTAKTLYSTSASPTFTASDAGKYVRTKITPRAATGLLNGIEYYGGWTLIDAAIKPYATNVNISGKAEQGSTLTGTYTYNGGTNGVTTYTENTLGSTYQWQTASNNKGVNIATMSYPDGGTAFGKTIRPTINDVNKYIRFGVIAKDNQSTPNSATSYVYSDWVGPITIAPETAPIAKDVSFSPAPGTFVTAKAKYTFEDANNDPEGASIYQWYFATDASGTNQTAITGATSSEFVITNEYAGKYIGFGITPKALTGNLTGTEVVYYAPTPSTPAASFTIVSATQSTNNFYKNRVMSASDYITLKINVTTAGSLKFTTNTANGYSFSAEGVFSTGSQDVTLVAKGTLSAYNGTGDNFTITGIGATTNTTTTAINNVKLGDQFTDFYNGIVTGVHNTTNVSDATYYLKTSYTTGETFNNNNTCLTKPISTSACVGTTITVGSNTYSITNINGQCWMLQNLKELPNGVPINTSQVLNGNSDLGYYGFYNTTSSSVWATTEPAANEGMLYQWSAAMMGSTTERAKGVCPTGWHIPSECEWAYLEHGLGLSLVNQAAIGESRGNATTDGNVGSKLSNNVSQATNSTGFTALTSGRLQGSFIVRGGNFNFWTSTTSATDVNNGLTCGLKSNLTSSTRSFDNKRVGFSVRCLKD